MKEAVAIAMIASIERLEIHERRIFDNSGYITLRNGNVLSKAEQTKFFKNLILKLDQAIYSDPIRVLKYFLEKGRLFDCWCFTNVLFENLLYDHHLTLGELPESISISYDWSNEKIVAYKGIMKNAKKHGNWVSYWQNGRVRGVAEYFDGCSCGDHIYFDINGNLIS